MTTIENAARQALETLETISVDVKTTSNAYEAQRQAVEALRQALENHESAYQRGYLDGMAKPCIVIGADLLAAIGQACIQRLQQKFNNLKRPIGRP